MLDQWAAGFPQSGTATSANALEQEWQTKTGMADEDHHLNDSAIDSSGEPVVDSQTVPLVGIGASAGGIEAIAGFFDAMSASSGAAFVVVLHLSPDRESQLSAIVSRHTSMPVTEIVEGVIVQPDHVYVIAPASDVTIAGDTLHLTRQAQQRSQAHPVDVLFKSIAEQRQERAIAIVLSGTGTNGTQGIKEIKAAGGLILVEDPATARFDGMPRSAISAGVADHVLTVGDMPEKVLRYLKHGYLTAPDGLAVAADQQPVERLIALLRAHSGHEFHHYKPTTLLRRVNRRMSLHNLKELTHYIELLRAEPIEVTALVRDLLISVTSFFRDSEAWTTLDEMVLTQIIADHDHGASLRVWVPACATGEEAYTIAMLLIEHADIAQKQFDLKVFATDILDDNLNVGRAGVYPGASVDFLPPERILRFFEKLNGSYRVRKTLRDNVVFARHDLLADPPFSRMDLVTCRNLLIYVEPESQRRALALFHFALREGGRLFLGSAETIGNADDLFETLSKKWRIYRRIGATRHDIVRFPLFGSRSGAGRTDGPSPTQPSVGVTEAARRVLLDRYAPASVLIDRRGRVLYFHGETGDYLKQPSGEPTRDLLAMARDGLLVTLRSAMRKAVEDNEPTRFVAQIRSGDTARSIVVTVTPVNALKEMGFLLVTFEPESQDASQTVPERNVDNGTDESSTLANELQATRAELQGTIEQLETLNEELKASNEESTSVNEELQSTNEELETSKEELQSFNEELHSINAQLQHKITELDQTSNDLANLLSGTEIATVFLDSSLRIKWFSPAIGALLDLVTSDIGRPIRHFATKFKDERLFDDADVVLAKLTPIEAEVRSDEGSWFVRRILPYRTGDDRIAGLVITFVDITQRKAAADAVDEARVYAEAIVATARQPMVVLDKDLRVRSANRAFYALLHSAPSLMEGGRLYEVEGGEWDVPELRRLLDEVLLRDQQFVDFELALGSEGRPQRALLLNACKLTRSSSPEELILLAMEDITERKRSADHQDMLIGELNHRVKNVLSTVQAVMSQTLRQSHALDDFATAFVGRIHAMAQAHDLIADKNWEGTEIGLLVDRTLAPYRSEDRSRIVIEGPPLSVRPQEGVALVMILHELATNAAKYGALSVPTGKLSVIWDRSADATGNRIHVRWSETSGPKVRRPTRQGFGTRLIERSTAHELGGEAQLEYLEEGVQCELTFPWSDVTSMPHRR